MSAFVDTNVLVYAADEVRPLPRKTRIARELLRQPDLVLSVQVLSEFVVAARNTRKLNLDHPAEAQWVRRWLNFPIVGLNETTFAAALDIHNRFELSHWDCLILASAAESHCPILYSEDLSDGQDYDGIRVVNPFK